VPADANWAATPTETCGSTPSSRTPRGNTSFSPIYVANYAFGDRHYQFLVSGQTGEVKESAPISWEKVGGIVGIAIGAGAAIAALLGVF
jgi:hypothetical protein